MVFYMHLNQTRITNIKMAILYSKYNQSPYTLYTVASDRWTYIMLQNKMFYLFRKGRLF